MAAASIASIEIIAGDVGYVSFCVNMVISCCTWIAVGSRLVNTCMKRKLNSKHTFSASQEMGDIGRHYDTQFADTVGCVVVLNTLLLQDANDFIANQHTGAARLADIPRAEKMYKTSALVDM